MILADIGMHRIIGGVGVSSVGATMPGLHPGQNYGAPDIVMNPKVGRFKDQALQYGFELVDEAAVHAFDRRIYLDGPASRKRGYVSRKQEPELPMTIFPAAQSMPVSFIGREQSLEIGSLDKALTTRLSYQSYHHPTTDRTPLHVVTAAVRHEAHRDEPVSEVQWMHAFALGYMIAESVVVRIARTDKIPEDRAGRLGWFVQGAFMYAGTGDSQHWEFTLDTEQSDGRVAVVAGLRHSTFVGEFPIAGEDRFSGTLDIEGTLGLITTKTDMRGTLLDNPKYGWPHPHEVPKLKIPDELIPLLSHFLVGVKGDKG